MYFNCTRENRSGGGLALIAHESLCISLVRHICFDYLEAALFTFNNLGSNGLLMLVYRPPSANFNNFITELCNLFSEMLPNCHSFICFGDFNVHFNKRDYKIFLLEDLLKEYGLYHSVHEPTHNKGNILDLVLSFENNKPQDVSVYPFDKSDHHFIKFLVQILFIQTKMKVLTYRSWKNVNLTEFGDTLESSLDLNVGLGICQNNSNLLTVFNQTMETITDFMAPIKKRNKLIRECDFFDSELIFMKRKRRKLERMYRKKKIVFDDFKEFDREMRNCFAAKNANFFGRKLRLFKPILRNLEPLINF